MTPSPAWLREVLEGGEWGSWTGWTFLKPDFISRSRSSAIRLQAPSGALATLDFLESLQLREWAGMEAPSAVLAEEIAQGRRWIRPDVVPDAGTLSRIALSKPPEAPDFFLALAPLSGRSEGDPGRRLVRAHLDRFLSLR
jgi:hypothetical protein